MTQVLSIFDLPHREVRAALETGAPVFLAVNPVEYHGPHLPLHCDALVSEGLTRELHARLAEKHPEWPLLVATNIEMGVEPCPGPGTRAVPYPVVKRVVVDACRALADLGAQRVVLITFHGAPLHNLALEAGVRYLAARGVRALAPLHLILRTLLDFIDHPPPQELIAPAYAHVEDEDERRAMMDGLALDFHGGFFETSVLLHYAPQAVSANYREVPPCPPFGAEPRLDFIARAARAIGLSGLARELHFGALGMGWYGLRPFPGYTGRPHRATPGAGAFFAKFIIDRYVEAAEGVFEHQRPAPAPIMPWVALASLGGRAGSVHVPNDLILGPGAQRA